MAMKHTILKENPSKFTVHVQEKARPLYGFLQYDCLKKAIVKFKDLDKRAIKLSDEQVKLFDAKEVTDGGETLPIRSVTTIITDGDGEKHTVDFIRHFKNDNNGEVLYRCHEHFKRPDPVEDPEKWISWRAELDASRAEGDERGAASVDKQLTKLTKLAQLEQLSGLSGGVL